MCSRNSTGKRSSSWPKRCAMASWLSQLARNWHSMTRPRLKQRQKRAVSGRSCWWLDIALRTKDTEGKSEMKKSLRGIDPAFGGVVASRGGIPLIEQGDIIGAIGCSGGADSQDEVVSKAGAAVINKLPARIK